MNRLEYARRRKDRKQNTILILSVTAAVILVAVLVVMKLIGGNRPESAKAGKEKEPEQPAVESAAVEQTAAQPEPMPTPRPKAVALTFDDGPSRANDGKILNALQKYGAHATFFVLGDRARVDGDILQMYIAAGCEIASHSWNHPQLSKLKWKRVERQLNKTNKTVKKLTNGYEIGLLRPPYGSVSEKMRKKLDVPMILWSLDTLDWKSRNVKKIQREVKKNIKDGDIILMHDIYDTTAKAVEKLLPWMQEQGYDILSVSELMERKGKTLKPGKVYLDGR